MGRAHVHILHHVFGDTRAGLKPWAGASQFDDTLFVVVVGRRWLHSISQEFFKTPRSRWTRPSTRPTPASKGGPRTEGVSLWVGGAGARTSYVV